MKPEKLGPAIASGGFLATNVKPDRDVDTALRDRQRVTDHTIALTSQTMPSAEPEANLHQPA